MEDIAIPICPRQREFARLILGPSTLSPWVHPWFPRAFTARRPLSCLLQHAPHPGPWLKDAQGRACIKHLLTINAQSYSTHGRILPKNGKSRNYSDEWMFSSLAEKGLVLAVYRGKPDAKNPPLLIPGPKPFSSGSLQRPIILPEIIKMLGCPEQLPPKQRKP